MSAASSDSIPRRGSELAACLASTLLGGLAGGVLWCFVSLSTRHDTDFVIVLIGAALGLLARWQGFPRGLAMISAALSCVLAFTYAEYLFAAARIAQMLGLPLRQALFKSGFALTADIAWGNLRARDGVMLAIAIVLAMVVATLRRKRRT